MSDIVSIDSVREKKLAENPPISFSFFPFLTSSKGDWQIVGKFADSGVSDMCQEARRGWRTLGTGLGRLGHFFCWLYTRGRDTVAPVRIVIILIPIECFFLPAPALGGGNRYDSGYTMSRNCKHPTGAENSSLPIVSSLRSRHTIAPMSYMRGHYVISPV